MKAITEHFIVSVIAVGMSVFGYWLIDLFDPSGPNLFNPKDVGWTCWSSVVSVLTWIYLYRMCRNLHWLVLPLMGVFSPVVGALLFFVPYLWMPFIVVWTYAGVIFPTGIVCGFLISLATLPFRPHQVLHKNVEKIRPRNDPHRPSQGTPPL